MKMEIYLASPSDIFIKIVVTLHEISRFFYHE